MELDAIVTDPAVPAAGDFDRFFRELFPRVARTAALVARDRQLGPDLAQEAFARLYERWDRMESVDHARNFAFRVAVNLAKSHLRRRQATSFGLVSPLERRDADPAARSVDWLGMVDALAALSGRQRSCVVLVDYADMDAATVAEILGMAEPTVRVHLMRGRRVLRERLGMQMEEDDR
jgi:RNA polymerase sigma factor (sigma-70 family)